MDKLHIAGLLLLLAGSMSLMGIITAEAFYPGYSTANNAISDLGVGHPSAILFNATLIIFGLIGLSGFYILFTVWGSFKRTLPMFLFAAGIVGVGTFPENYAAIHFLFALIAFASGAISAMASYRYTTAPFKYVGLLLGLISLISLVIYMNGPPTAGLPERWIVYPVALWLVGFGGYLMGGKETEK